MPDPALAGPPGPAVRGATLLLVDDEPSVLSALRRLFRSQGYAIEQATSGADALALMQGKDIDLVISDMRMPVMDGAAFLEAVRQRHPSTVRILLTGYADIGSTVAAINRGEIHRYIAKPWDDNDLQLIVAEALKRRDLERENASLLALTRQQNQALRDLNMTLEERVEDRTSQLEQSTLLLADANAELESNFTKVVTVFTGLLEMRQVGIAGHARRVGALAQRMAVKLGLDERAQREVQLAALLHDIGEIGYDDAMLGKPVSTYSAEQTQRYWQHPLDGEAALMSLDKLAGVATIVRQHHERFDGRGFPDGLAGDNIQVGARIIGIASDYDALTAGSLGEQSYDPSKAREAIAGGLGTHYDAQVLGALCAVLDEMAAEANAELVIEIGELRPRMVLARDLLSPQGAVLLPANYQFDVAMVAKLTAFASRAPSVLKLPILARSITPPAAARKGAIA